MQIVNTLFVAAAALAVGSQAYVVTLFEHADCTGNSFERNVWDNTCAYTAGFQSLKMTVHGGGLQQLTAYSRQACAGATTFQACAAGVNSIKLGECHRTTNGDGGSNALSSYSSGGPCPN